MNYKLSKDNNKNDKNKTKMKEFRIVWKSLAGQADEEVVTSANKSKIFQCYDALCIATLEYTDNKKLAYHTFEAIAQDFAENELKENPLFKTAQRIVVAAIDKDEKETIIAEDKYAYFFRTPENAELYDNFRAYTNKLLYQI